MHVSPPASPDPERFPFPRLLTPAVNASAESKRPTDPVARALAEPERLAEPVPPPHSPVPVDPERPTSPRLPAPERDHPDAPGSDAASLPEYDDTQRIPQCPSRPPNTRDPRSVWIGDRAYYPGGANNYVRDAATVLDYVFVNVKKGCIVSDTRGTHPEEIETYTKLGGNLSSFYWPGRIQQADEFSLPIPQSTAGDYSTRYREMCFQRKEYEILIHRVTELLSTRQKAECCSPYIYLYQTKTDSHHCQSLVRLRLDRAYVLMRVNPVWNPYLRPIEASFLRSAYYFLAYGGNRLYAEHIDRVLRTPSFDDWEIRELLCLGMFETEDRESDAMRYFDQVDRAHWAFHASEAAAPRTYTGTIIFMQTDPEDTDSESDPSDTPTVSNDQAMPDVQETITVRTAAPRSNHPEESNHAQERGARREHPDMHPSW
ncbi:hypothetical protein FIBSPDRAFT_970564 [Athelia psychrophila]|uniref:Uncharacterized protein n=1 Tax=Athelia psychrophila TaxID=1759441 RepID=A0A167SM76_9AGAM|nr:hypothetical protein FIBSPDRAFT_970564 [Fibularhizoctonia sp. CBS 109695]